MNPRFSLASSVLVPSPHMLREAEREITSFFKVAGTDARRWGECSWGSTAETTQSLAAAASCSSFALAALANECAAGHFGGAGK